MRRDHWDIYSPDQQLRLSNFKENPSIPDQEAQAPAEGPGQLPEDEEVVPNGHCGCLLVTMVTALSSVAGVKET